MRPQPLTAVTDVEASGRWYQQLLGCGSAHGGGEYERLVCGGEFIMQLHSFDARHHHGPIGDVSDKPYGNGVLIWFETEDFESVWQRAQAMDADIVLPRRRNPNAEHWETWLHDPDGYTVVIASPDKMAMLWNSRLSQALAAFADKVNLTSSLQFGRRLPRIFRNFNVWIFDRGHGNLYFCRRTYCVYRKNSLHTNYVVHFIHA